MIHSVMAIDIDHFRIWAFAKTISKLEVLVYHLEIHNSRMLSI